MACFLSLKESKTQRKSVYKKINQRNGAHFSLWSSKQIILFTFLLDKMKLLINLQQFLPDQHVEVSFYILCYVIIFASFSLSTFFFSLKLRDQRRNPSWEIQWYQIQTGIIVLSLKRSVCGFENRSHGASTTQPRLNLTFIFSIMILLFSW